MLKKEKKKRKKKKDLYDRAENTALSVSTAAGVFKQGRQTYVGV